MVILERKQLLKELQQFVSFRSSLLKYSSTVCIFIVYWSTLESTFDVAIRFPFVGEINLILLRYHAIARHYQIRLDHSDNQQVQCVLVFAKYIHAVIFSKL